MASQTEDEEFCRNYLVLKPREASFLDLLRFLLFSSDIGARRRSVHCPIEEAGERLWAFDRRWVVFISLVLQKLLLLMEKGLARTGYRVEMWLNLLNINGGVLGLLWNILRGEVQQPDPESALYTSVIRFVDRRVDLDSSIMRRDPRYNASLSMMAAKLAYENPSFVRLIIDQHWKMECLGYYNFWNENYATDSQREPSTGAIVLRDRNLIVVAFRGTRPFNADDWRTDVDISWYELDGVGNAHKGFMKALGIQRDKGWPREIRPSDGRNRYAYYELRSLLKERLAGSEGEGMKFIVTGHSLGGALAILFASVLVMHEEWWLLERLDGVYTFGQPRVGDARFGDYVRQRFETHGVKYSRYVYCNDIVPRLPFDDKVLMFKHFGSCLFFNSWFYRGKVLEEEPNKNYFSPLWAIPKVLNAAWEFVRGFIIPYMEGPNYRESWLIKLLRLLGTYTIPGIPAHCPQDYVNLTRLGRTYR